MLVTRGSGRGGRTRGAGDRADRARLGGGDRRAAGGDGPAPAPRRRSAARPGERAAAHGAGSRRRRRAGDRRDAARRRARHGWRSLVNARTFALSALLDLHDAPTPGAGRRRAERAALRPARHGLRDGPAHALRRCRFPRSWPWSSSRTARRPCSSSLYAEQSLGLGAGGYGVPARRRGRRRAAERVVNGRLATSRQRLAHRGGAGALFCATQLVYAGRRRRRRRTAASRWSAAPAWSPARWSPRRPSPGSSRRDVLGPRDGGVRRRCRWRRWSPARCSPPCSSPRPRCRRASWSSARAAVLVDRRSACPGCAASMPLSRQRAEALASRVAVLEQAADHRRACRGSCSSSSPAAAQLCPLPPGVDVVVQGAPAHAFYAVVDGRGGRPPRRHEVVQLGPGRAASASAACSTTPRGTRP